MRCSRKSVNITGRGSNNWNQRQPYFILTASGVVLNQSRTTTRVWEKMRSTYDEMFLNADRKIVLFLALINVLIILNPSLCQITFEIQYFSPYLGAIEKAKLVKWYQCIQNPAIAMKMPHDFPATNIVSAIIKVCRPWPCLQIIMQGDLNMECFNTSKYPKLTVFSILHFLLNITTFF